MLKPPLQWRLVPRWAARGYLMPFLFSPFLFPPGWRQAAPHCAPAGQSRLFPCLGILVLLSAGTGQAAARTLTAGPGEEYGSLAAALRAAQPGDTVRLASGVHYACAVIEQSHVVLEGTDGGQTVLSDKMCEDKASLVIRGRGVTVRKLSLMRARVPDGNGAGIRAEGHDLVVAQVRFENNQVGLLAGGSFRGALRLQDCTFTRSGNPGSDRPTGALIVGAADVLEVLDSRFEAGRAGGNVISAASLTRIRGGALLRPAASPTATVQVAGALVMEDVILEPGAGPGGRLAGVLALPGSGKGRLDLLRNRLEGDGALLLNWSGRQAVLDGNRLGPGSEAVSTSGAWTYRARSAVRELLQGIRHMGGAVRGWALSLIR